MKKVYSQIAVSAEMPIRPVMIMMLCLVLALAMMTGSTLAQTGSGVDPKIRSGVDAPMDPATADRGAQIVLLAVFASVAIYGFYVALAGRPIFVDALEEEQAARGS